MTGFRENLSTAIKADNQFQVYQGDLPPLANPMGFSGKAIAGGRVSLRWDPVEGAIGYQLYRRNGSDAEMQPLHRLDGVTTYEDAPPTEDIWV